MKIFTDGSCHPNPGPGSWAWVAYSGPEEVDSASCAVDGTTNNRMELQAILEALRWLDGRPAQLFSDSQYAVKGINTWTAGWKRRGWKRKDKAKGMVPVLNIDLWQAIDAARRPGQTIEWVRGHNGNVGNERADHLALLARRTGTRAHSSDAQESYCMQGQRFWL